MGRPAYILDALPPQKSVDKLSDEIDHDFSHFPQSTVVGDESLRTEVYCGCKVDRIRRGYSDLI